jgi:hypothetical protein
MLLFCAFWLFAFSATLHGQQETLFINEVISDNATQEPADVGGGHPDILELYSASDQEILLGGATAARSYFLSDKLEFSTLTAWRFPNGTAIGARSFLVVFCDGNGLEGVCELHASFAINNNGTEAVTLWGPVPEGGTDADRPVIDRVWMPPMRADVSFGRYPDGAGPAPVPLAETFSVFHFFPRGTCTFGSCVEAGGNCFGGMKKRACLGAPNGAPGNLEPRLDLVLHSTNRPAAGEPVSFVARVEDDAEPTPPNIARVLIRYSVNGVEKEPVAMVYDAESGVETGAARMPPRPLERWTLWQGSIPAQEAGALVKFEFYVEDQQGLSSTDPRDLCPEGVGPCNNLGIPGPNCVKEVDALGLEGPQYVPCRPRRQYLVGYSPVEPFSRVLINEVAAVQDRLLEDRSEPPCAEDEDPRCRYDDFIELCNGSNQPADLSGCWLSDSPFHPQEWQFPSGSLIQPGEYLIVWLDDDGGKCPRPSSRIIGDGQECPDPTDPARDEFHANFSLSSEGDDIFLYDREERGFGVLHGVTFGLQALNVTLSLTPDCTREGTFIAVPGGSPRAPNPGGPPQPNFRRGDANGDCSFNITDPTYTLNFLFLSGPPPPCPDAADADDTGSILLTDAVFALNYLFLSGPAPPAPGPSTAGPDPSDDKLAACAELGCGG